MRWSASPRTWAAGQAWIIILPGGDSVGARLAADDGESTAAADRIGLRPRVQLSLSRVSFNGAGAGGRPMMAPTISSRSPVLLWALKARAATPSSCVAKAKSRCSALIWLPPV